MSNRNTSQHYGRKIGLAGLLLSAACMPQAARAQGGAGGAPAGTRVDNVATRRWTVEGNDARTSSNTVTLVVAERLDVALAAGTANANDVAAVRLTNSGNGSEAFAVAATLASGVAVRGIAIDRDGDGRYDPAVDTLLDGTTPPLAAGASLALLVLLPPGANGTLTVNARATTGSGTPGTGYPNAGDGGGDAVVGPTGAAAQLVVALSPGQAAGEPTLVKSQAIRAPDGSTRAVSGAIVTYTLAAIFAGPTRAPRIEDPVPAGTAYLPGSLRLDGVVLTDAADGDAGGFDGTRIAVALGDVAAPAAGAGPVTRTVTFQVRLP